jgi:hypothetical protein
MARNHRHQYEADDQAFPADAYTVRGHAGIAFYVLGWEVEADEDTEWSGCYNRTGQVVAVMIGDDHRWIVDLDDLQPLDRDAYCGECGQIGCAHDIEHPRITRFVDWFIRQDCIAPDVQELLLSDPERANRMYDAAENGADGSTHQEVINDWRDAFRAFIRDRRTGSGNDPERFMAAVEAHFDSVEEWHQTNGSLYQEVG